MNVRLIKLTKEYYHQLVDMIDEWKLDPEINHTNHSPWVIYTNKSKRDYNSYYSPIHL